MPAHALLDSAPPHPPPALVDILLDAEDPIPEPATGATGDGGAAVVARPRGQINVMVSARLGDASPREWRVGGEVRRRRDGHGQASGGAGWH